MQEAQPLIAWLLAQLPQNPLKPMLTAARRLILACLIPALASAQNNVWVDPVHGDDATGSLDPSLPFQTIQAAANLAQSSFPNEMRFLVLRTGVYSNASGESFPLVLESRTQLVADQEAEFPIIRHRGGPVLRFSGIHTGLPLKTLVRGIHFDGVSVSGDQNQIGIRAAPVGVHLQDCLVENFTVGFEDRRATLENCVFGNGRFGYLYRGGNAIVTGCQFLGSDGLEVGINVNVLLGTVDLTVTDSTFLECDSGVFGVLNGYEDAGVTLAFDRCKFLGNNRGVICFSTVFGQGGSSTALIRSTNSLFAGNQNSIAFFLDGFAEGSFEGCTLDGKGQSEGPVHPAASFDMHNCISVGHTLRDDDHATPTSCFLGSGPFAGVGSNLTGPDPGFRDAANGDYSLHSASVCLDQGVDPSSSKDLRGLPRRVDGLLDGIHQVDMGAFEMQTMLMPAQVALGQPYGLELNGPAGANYVLLLSRTGLAATPTDTPFGSLQLPTVQSTRLLQGVYPADGRAELTFFAPAAASSIGNTYAFQALASDFASQQSPRLTQAAAYVVVAP